MLVFDADDTLWENNVHFERVVADYLTWLAHPTLDEAAIRSVLRDVESANVTAHGYGSQVFLRTLHDVFERLYDRPATAGERQQVIELARAVVTHQIEMIPDVAETLRELGTRHDLALLTKGATQEQQAKIDASGLAGHFGSVHIVSEKTADTYLRLASELSLDPATTWMIGNSPKSDIIAARRAGWNTVFIPNQYTWEHEHEELDPHDGAILHLAKFRELTAHF